MQTANTDALQGLVFHDLGNRGSSNAYAEAACCYQRALDYFQTFRMYDITWKICFYLADVDFMQSFWSLTDEEQQALQHNAALWLEKPAADIELVRGRYIETDLVARETARLGLVEDKEKVYRFAVRLHYWHLNDPNAAFNWLERLKGRAFLDSLALTFLRPPVKVDKTVLDRERELLAAINHVSTQVSVVDLSDRLQAIWKEIAGEPAASEYVSLRLGEPVSWQTVQSLLGQ
jgi:hypothetical protein